MCAFSVICTALAIKMDHDMDAKIAKQSDYVRVSVQDENDNLVSYAVHKSEIEKEGNEHQETTSVIKQDESASNSFKDILAFSSSFWILCLLCAVIYGCIFPFNNISSSLLLERDYFKEPPSQCHLFIETQCQSASNDAIQCPSSDVRVVRLFFIVILIFLRVIIFVLNFTGIYLVDVPTISLHDCRSTISLDDFFSGNRNNLIF
jgi:hypothetical protein